MCPTVEPVQEEMGLLSQGAHNLNYAEDTRQDVPWNVSAVTAQVRRASGEQKCCRTRQDPHLGDWMCLVGSSPLAAHAWGRKVHHLLTQYCWVLLKEEHKHLYSLDIMQVFSAVRMKLPE